MSQVANDLGLGLPAGAPHYRAYVGPPEDYDLIAAMSFGLLTALGLRQHHRLLDVGCGSLRIGRLLIPYLNAGHYAGIEPHRWLVEEGIAKELGASLLEIKRPVFHFSDSAKDLKTPEGFDFAIAQSIFSHTGMDLMQEWLCAVSHVMKPSGAFAANFMIGNSDTMQSGWIYPGCVQYRTETMQRCAGKAGFGFRVLPWRHPRLTWALLYGPQFDISWFEDRPLGWNTWLDHGPKQFAA